MKTYPCSIKTPSGEKEQEAKIYMEKRLEYEVSDRK
jgi:hypothetical protein